MRLCVHVGLGRIWFMIAIKLYIYESDLRTNIIIGNIVRSLCLTLVKEREREL